MMEHDVISLEFVHNLYTHWRLKMKDVGGECGILFQFNFLLTFFYFVLIHLCVKEEEKNYGKPSDCMAISVIADLMIHFSQCTQKDAFAITIVDYKVVKLDGNRPKWKIIKRNNRIIEHSVP